MADTGLILVGTGENVPVDSNTDWVNPSNITVENDSTYAEADIRSSDDFSDYLRATNLGLSVPSGATIDGVEVEVRKEGESTSGANIYDKYVYLVGNGSAISGCENKAKFAEWGDDVPFTASYGGSADTWNCSLTSSIVNSSTFGVQLMAENRKYATRWARVYWIKVKVYYTEDGGGTTCQVVAVGAGSGDANVNATVAKSLEGEAGGYGEALVDTKVAQRVESEAAGCGDAFVLVNDRTEYRAKGAAKGNSEATVSVWQLKNIHGFGYGGSSGAMKVKGSKHVLGQGVGAGDALVFSFQRIDPFAGLDGVAAVMVDRVLGSLSSSGVEMVVDMAPALSALIRAVCEGVAHIFPEPAELASAWVNFRDTGTAIEINASFNISGVTRNGTGDYTVMFASDMPNAEYTLAGIAAAGSSSSPAGNSYVLSPRVVSNEFSLKTISSVRVVVCDNNNDSLSARAFNCNLVIYAA
ncbi:hypothetical protein OO185_04250 [Prosthecochloris sp. SCSIO W1102]|uniref:hypothetical protein n=1 Tax=Prosthecochloris sp. SCSIO W1102 TaxID=2992243 RepID=UPI00223E5AB5|nr:hypothetical protein [Prosthecochloris sp. SCSIO W1102]UZJ39150.1 hypothetical protein OO185_04250 [Prosthecochloris sp. SCSIO W1102]